MAKKTLKKWNQKTNRLYNSMKKDDIISEVILKDLKKREHLQQMIHQSAFAYHTRNKLLKLPLILFYLVLIGWLLIKQNVPDWGFVVSFFSFFSWLEIGRQNDRFNALLKLNELEKQITKIKQLNEEITLHDKK